MRGLLGLWLTAGGATTVMAGAGTFLHLSDGDALRVMALGLSVCVVGWIVTTRGKERLRRSMMEVETPRGIWRLVGHLHIYRDDDMFLNMTVQIDPDRLTREQLISTLHLAASRVQSGEMHDGTAL